MLVLVTVIVILYTACFVGLIVWTVWDQRRTRTGFLLGQRSQIRRFVLDSAGRIACLALEQATDTFASLPWIGLSAEILTNALDQLPRWSQESEDPHDRAQG